MTQIVVVINVWRWPMTHIYLIGFVLIFIASIDELIVFYRSQAHFGSICVNMYSYSLVTRYDCFFEKNDCCESVLYESFSPSPIWVTSLSCGEQLIDMLTCVPCVFISLTIYGHIGTFFCIISKFITQLKSTERVYKYIMHIKDKLAPYNRAMNLNTSCVYPENTHHFRTSHFIVDLNKLRLFSGEFVHLQTEQVQFVKGVTLLFKSPFGRYWITINEYYSCNYSGNVFVLLESIRESNVRLTTK